MQGSGIFVFGTKIFPDEMKRDIISIMPLELSWKIFSYLDDKSLRISVHTNKTWANIICANKKLRKRLNKFELAIRLGSASLVKFYRKNKKKMKKDNPVNYLPQNKSRIYSTEQTVFRPKRQGSDIEIYTKRFKLF